MLSLAVQLQICLLPEFINLLSGTATLTDSGGTTENMSAGTNRYGYSGKNHYATGCFDTSKTSANAYLWTQYHADPVKIY